MKTKKKMNSFATEGKLLQVIHNKRFLLQITDKSWWIKNFKTFHWEVWEVLPQLKEGVWIFFQSFS